MNASGPSSIDRAGAVSRVKKISAGERLYGKRDGNRGGNSGGQARTPRKPSYRSGTEDFEPIRYGLWRHAPFVAQLIGQILPRKDVGSAVMQATYDERPRIMAAIFDAMA
ncbi:MAG TPA: hypothetical protein VK779_05725 [Rhizomicrobium sp.]|jgi:hypothetical protein|nr:hypothetical protein [Rhizomicrobium sp.]